jgi:hypothetical protein
MSTFLFIESQNCRNKDELDELLNESCKRYSYHALVARMEANLEKIKFMQFDKDLETINRLKEAIFDDAAVMGNIYRAMGDIASARIIQGVATEIFQKGVSNLIDFYNRQHPFTVSSKESKDVEKPSLITLFEKILSKALEYYCLAAMTENDDISIELNKSINQGKNLLAAYQKEFKDWRQGRTYMTKKLIPENYNMKYCSSELFFQHAEDLAEENLSALSKCKP